MQTSAPGFPELLLIDTVDAHLPVAARLAAIEELAPIHHEYFPAYPHVLDELREYARTGEDAHGERIHAFLLRRAGRPVGEWILNVNPRKGVVLVLFVAIHREARIDLDRSYLTALIDFTLQRCVDEAAELGETLVAAIVESDDERLHRWQEGGFILVDPDYHEPVHGRGWASADTLRYFEEYSACVRPLEGGSDIPFDERAALAIEALLVDHYGLPADNPQVRRSLDVASSCGSGAS